MYDVKELFPEALFRLQGGEVLLGGVPEGALAAQSQETLQDSLGKEETGESGLHGTPGISGVVIKSKNSLFFLF